MIWWYSGFIYTILICIACCALWKALKVNNFYPTFLVSTDLNYNQYFIILDRIRLLYTVWKIIELSIFDPFFTDPFLLLKDRWRRNLGKLKTLRIILKWFENFTLQNCLWSSWSTSSELPSPWPSVSSGRDLLTNPSGWPWLGNI